VEKINENSTDDDIIEYYKYDLRVQGKTERGIENYESCIKDYKKWLHGKELVFKDVQGKKGNHILKEYVNYLRNEKKKKNGEPLAYTRIIVYFSALNQLYDMLVFEEIIDNNNVLAIRKRYLKSYKNGYTPANRQYITAEEMSKFIKSIFDLKTKAIVTVFVKTGIRKSELISLNVDDVDFDKMTITLRDKKLRKREKSNNVVLFDDECKRILELWLQRHKTTVKDGVRALFTNEYGQRMNKNTPYNYITYWSKRAGLHDVNSSALSDRFSCHNLRHCFTTYLEENKMYEPYVEWLRGDSAGKSIDKYKHFDKLIHTSIREEYNKAMPIFGI